MLISKSFNMTQSTLPIIISKQILSIGGRLSYIGIVFILLLTTSGCRKDNKPPPSPEKSLKIVFSTNTIDFQLVDSAYVLLQKAGMTEPIKKFFKKGNQSLDLPIGDLAEGDWGALAYIYAQLPKRKTNISHRYEQTLSFTVTSSGLSPETKPGPDGTLTNDWRPHGVITDALRSIFLTVPLDCRDAYYEFVINDPKWDFFYIDRTAMKRNAGGVEIVASGQWWCDNACYGQNRIIRNRVVFQPFIQDLGSKFWELGMVDAFVRNQATGEVAELYYLFNKP